MTLTLILTLTWRSDSILNAKLDAKEVEEMKHVMSYQMQDMPVDVLLKEGIQIAAYGGGQSLGMPHFCTEEGLGRLNREMLGEFRNKFLVAERMVLAGAGVNHEEFVRLGEKYFGEMAGEMAGVAGGVAGGAKKLSTYTGGEYRLEKEGSDNFTRIALAFEVGGWHDDDLVGTCVLQILLGGGDSFSAGGPGKGMYSRLYREVLNRFYWAEASEAFTSLHDESGLLGISGSSVGGKSGKLTMVFLEHFAKLAMVKVTDEELSRAKNMLKCNVLTQMESRPVVFEDIGRQMLTYGRRDGVDVVCNKIEMVEADDILRIAKKCMMGKPSIASVGADLSTVPRVEEISRLIIA